MNNDLLFKILSDNEIDLYSESAVVVFNNGIVIAELDEASGQTVMKIAYPLRVVKIFGDTEDFLPWSVAE